MGSISGDTPKMAQLKKTAIAALEGYNSWKIDNIMSYRHETAVHEILPKTLNRPIMDNTTYRSYFSAIMPYFRNFHVVVNDLLIDTSADKVAIWAKSTGETDLGEYANEYMLVFFMDESGTKIVRSLEFVDSAVTKPYMEELGRYVREKKGSEAFEKRYVGGA